MRRLVAMAARCWPKAKGEWRRCCGLLSLGHGARQRHSRTATARHSWRFVAAVLLSPVSILLLVGYELVALPVAFAVSLCRGLDASAAVKLSLKPLRWDFGDRIDGGVLQFLDPLWFPFWRQCTDAGRRSCVYVNLADSSAVAPSSHSPWELPPRPDRCCRFVMVSDTHGRHGLVNIPDGDVLCHSGDIMLSWRTRVCGGCRAAADLRRFDEWLDSLPHRHKVVIGGNHDGPLEAVVSDGTTQPFANALYLQNSGATLMLDSGVVHVYGTPWSAPGNSPNQAFRARSIPLLGDIPTGMDVLLAHSTLPDYVLARTAPRIHAVGHAHEEHGVRRLDIPSLSERSDECKLAPGTPILPTSPPVSPALCPNRSAARMTGILEVNAAVCDENYSAIQPVIVVDLPVRETGSFVDKFDLVAGSGAPSARAS